MSRPRGPQPAGGGAAAASVAAHPDPPPAPPPPAAAATAAADSTSSSAQSRKRKGTETHHAAKAKRTKSGTTTAKSYVTIKAALKKHTRIAALVPILLSLSQRAAQLRVEGSRLANLHFLRLFEALHQPPDLDPTKKTIRRLFARVRKEAKNRDNDDVDRAIEESFSTFSELRGPHDLLPVSFKGSVENRVITLLVDDYYVNSQNHVTVNFYRRLYAFIRRAAIAIMPTLGLQGKKKEIRKAVKQLASSITCSAGEYDGVALMSDLQVVLGDAYDAQAAKMVEFAEDQREKHLRTLPLDDFLTDKRWTQLFGWHRELQVSVTHPPSLPAPPFPTHTLL